MKRKFYVSSFLVGAVFFVISSFYYLPYYVTKPGMAKELEPIIKVEDGNDEKGSFMLTTVRMGRANIYSYFIAKWSKYQELYPIDVIRSEGETDEEYNVRQLHLMDSSKLAAIEVAYKKAGIPIHYNYKGVYVLNVLPDMPAEGKLQSGDRIYQIDGQGFQSSEEFIEYVSTKKEGDTISLSFERLRKKEQVIVQIKSFKDNKHRIGVGIVLVDDKEIIVVPKVTVKTEEIGGPSAGLMFSLEIYNQLVDEDLTKGYTIAGTGTISPEGKVGRIGGIEQKIIAADKAGAEIFLAPHEDGVSDSNYIVALRTAKDIKSEMKIVPINKFSDAVSYLTQLKEK